MNINLTMLGQLIAFIMFVTFCMKFVWPPIMNALYERKKTIADGLAAAERGHREQQLAEERAKKVLWENKTQATEIITRAEKRASEIVDEAKEEARAEGKRLLVAARADISQEVNIAKEALRAQLASITIAGASKVLEREIDVKVHNELLNKLAAEI
ncbi:MAG: F0F1 ATP synthase subunit B [Gammaproteobacteria bacterium]